MAAPTYVAATGAHDGLSGNISTFTWTIPASAAAGDVAVVLMGSNTGSATFTPPAGWSQIGTTLVTGSNHTTQAFGRVLQAGEPGTQVSFTIGTGGKLHGGGIVIRGAEGIPTNFASNSDTTTGNTLTTPGITSDSADNYIVSVCMARHTEITQQSVTGIGGTTVGWTERTDTGTASTTSPNFVACIATRNAVIAASGGVANGPTFTISASSATGHGWTFAFEPTLANTPPTISLAADKTVDVEPGSTVTLTATPADSDGTISSVSFAQTAGSPTVTLSGTGNTRTFTFPFTMDGATLTFTATATDDDGASTTSDPVTVTGYPAPIRIVVNGVLTPTDLRLPGSVTPVTRGLGYIGSTATYQNGSTEPRDLLVAAGWPESQIEVDGLADRGLALAGVTHPNFGEVVDAWRGNGFDPYTWVIALGEHNLGASDSEWTKLAGQLLDKVAEGPRAGYVVNFPGISLADAADTRPPRFIAVLNGLVGTRAKITLKPLDWNAHIHNGRDETGLWDTTDTVGRRMTAAGYSIRNNYITTQVGAPT
jgi:hypothetical protein